MLKCTETFEKTNDFKLYIVNAILIFICCTLYITIRTYIKLVVDYEVLNVLYIKRKYNILYKIHKNGFIIFILSEKDCNRFIYKVFKNKLNNYNSISHYDIESIKSDIDSYIIKMEYSIAKDKEIKEKMMNEEQKLCEYYKSKELF